MSFSAVNHQMSNMILELCKNQADQVFVHEIESKFGRLIIDLTDKPNETALKLQDTISTCKTLILIKNKAEELKLEAAQLERSGNFGGRNLDALRNSIKRFSEHESIINLLATDLRDFKDATIIQMTYRTALANLNRKIEDIQSKKVATSKEPASEVTPPSKLDAAISFLSRYV